MTVAALMDFDAWRDIPVERWLAEGVARPKTPIIAPGVLPPLLIPPLGVQLVDWAESGQYDEPLPRASAPWALPTAVTRDGQPDLPALAALAKKREYLPASWADERDDRKTTGGTMAVTFPAMPVSIPAGPLTFTARLNAAAAIVIDGVPCVLTPLGVNAHLPPLQTVRRRGWHTYAVAFAGLLRPTAATTYLMDFKGARCSQFLINVTSQPVPGA